MIGGGSVLALVGGALAGSIASAQGPYEPTTTTTTTTVAPPDEDRIKLKLGGTAGTQALSGAIEIDAEGRIVDNRQDASEPIFIAAYGRFAIKVSPGGRGAKCQGRPKPKDQRFKLKNDFATIRSGESTVLKLKVPRKAQKEARKQIICKDTKAKAVVRIRANDQYGNETTRDRTVKIRAGGS